MNINRSEFHSFVRAIVDQNFSEEIDFFDIDGKEIIDLAIEERPDYNENVRDSLEFKFGVGETAEAIKFIGVVVATLKTLKEFISWMNRSGPDDEQIEEKWRLRLIEEGLPEDKAQAIVDKFAADLKENFVKK